MANTVENKQCTKSVGLLYFWMEQTTANKNATYPRTAILECWFSCHLWQRCVPIRPRFDTYNYRCRMKQQERWMEQNTKKHKKTQKNTKTRTHHVRHTPSTNPNHRETPTPPLTTRLHCVRPWVPTCSFLYFQYQIYWSQCYSTCRHRGNPYCKRHSIDGW